jgi:hypothetical protein
MAVEDCKYLSDGNAVTVVRELAEGYLVQRIYASANEEGEWASGEVFLVDKVHDQAPTAKQDARLTKLRIEIDELYKTKSNLLEEINTAKKSESARLARYRKYEALRHLDDFIDGKITHYVVKNYSTWEIEDINSAKKNEYDRGNTKLLCLHGRSNGDLQWHLYDYSDGSGSHHEVFPCRSYEEALGRVCNELSLLESVNQYAVKSAEKYGAVLNAKALEDFRQKEHQSLAKIVEAKRTELDKALAALTTFDVGSE